MPDCRVRGLPCRSTTCSWRRAACKFDRQAEFMADEGRHGLINIVFAEIESVMEEHGTSRGGCSICASGKLVRVNPRYFEGA